MASAKALLKVYRLDQPTMARERLHAKGYELVPCQRAGFELYTAVHCRRPKWASFLDDLLGHPHEFATKETSFVLLRQTETGTYAVAGGLGYQDIQGLVERNFGLEVVTRLMPPDRIKILRDRALSGVVDQEQSVYRGHYNYVSDPWSWMKLIQLVAGDVVAADVQADFGIERKEKSAIRLEGSSGFSIRVSITADELDRMISRLDAVMHRDPMIPVMRGFDIAPKKYMDKLRIVLSTVLADEYQRYLDGPQQYRSANLSLTYEDAAMLGLCARFSVRRGKKVGSLDNLEIPALFWLLRDWGVRQLYPRSFLDMEVQGEDDDGTPLLAARIRQMLVADVILEGHSYIFVDSRWFVSTGDFIRSLDRRVEPFLAKDSQYSLPSWDEACMQGEDDYIEHVSHNSASISKLHREHVWVGGRRQAELCDLFDARSDLPFLVFVKKGFGAQARELARQAVDSVELATHDDAFLEAARVKLAECCPSFPDRANVDFKRCGVVLAVLDHLPARNGEPLVDRLTTVAKMELAFALEQLRSWGLPAVYLYEIPRTGTQV